MSDKDICNKIYMTQPEVFADTFNYFLYNGENIIKPQDLVEKSTEALALPYTKSGKRQGVQKLRDVFKGWITAKRDKRCVYLLLGIENQAEVHYAMAVRNMLYDALSYSEQVQAIARENRKREKQKSNKAGYNFLSGLCKEDKLIPVITLVIYFDADAWDGPRSLYEMFSMDMQDLKEFVPNYKLNILSPADIEHPEKFRSSMGKVMECLKYKNDKVKLRNLVDEDPSYNKLDVVTAQMLSANLNCKIQWDDSTGGYDMCKAIDDIREEGRMVGRAEGKAEGRAEGKAEGKAERNVSIAEEMLVDAEPVAKIKKYTKLPLEKLQEMAARLGVELVM